MISRYGSKRWRALPWPKPLTKTLLDAAKDLAANRVRVVTGECGFMSLHQQRLKQDLGLPVFDYVTMINYMFSVLVPRTYKGFM